MSATFVCGSAFLPAPFEKKRCFFDGYDGDYFASRACFVLRFGPQISEGQHGLEAALQPVRLHVALWHALSHVL